MVIAFKQDHKDLILKEENNYITTLSINRPDKKNALNADALFSLGDIIRGIKQSDYTRVIILRGTGQSSFSAGLDFSYGVKDYDRTIEGFKYCIASLLSFPYPIISMVFGPALGAGLDIAVISDFRLAAKNALFGAPLVKLGRIYYYTAIERLGNLAGLSATKELLLIGSFMDADRACQVGLINKVLDPDDLEAFTNSIAKQIAEEASPLSIRSTKYTINKIFHEKALSSGLKKQLMEIMDNVNQSQDAIEGLNAKLENRPPKFTGK